VIAGDFFSRDADAMVSPANSFGIMDGGLDLAIRENLGFEVQTKVQRMILDRHHGELPVGAAEVVETGHARWPHLVVAPTMRVPENIAQTTNAYVAFRATLLAIRRYNEAHGARIRSVLAPGLGTGVGRMDPRRCAAQMRVAFDHVRKPARIPSYAAIHETHLALLSAG
jgi:O-acetyl-ADP-ribose deacetylase (regulator of RNase III)